MSTVFTLGKILSRTSHVVLHNFTFFAYMHCVGALCGKGRCSLRPASFRQMHTDSETVILRTFFMS